MGGALSTLLSRRKLRKLELLLRYRLPVLFALVGISPNR